MRACDFLLAFLDLEQMLCGVDHATRFRRIDYDSAVANMSQPEAAHARLMGPDLAMDTLDERHFEGLALNVCHKFQPRISSTCLPRFAAISSGERACDKAFMVARTTLMGLREP